MIKKLFLILFGLFITVNCYAGTFGETEVSDFEDGTDDFQVVNIATFPATSGQQADSISVYVVYYSSGQKVRGALYNWTSGALIAETAEQTVTGTGWVTCAFASPPALTASQPYGIAIWKSEANACTLKYDSDNASITMQYKGKDYDLAWEDPWVAGTTYAGELSLYCTYSAIPVVTRRIISIQ